MFVMFALACTDGNNAPQFAGTKMSDYFAFDGERMSTFNNDDTTIDWQLVLTKKSQTSIVDQREVVTVEYTNNSTGEVLGSVQWSTVTGDATMIHGYSLGATGPLVTFDPPVEVTDGDDAMLTGDLVETDTTTSDGASVHVTSTYVEPVPECPTTAQADFVKCVHFSIDDGGATGALFTGELTLVAAWGVVFMTIPGWEQEWGLTQVEYTADEDGA